MGSKLPIDTVREKLKPATLENGNRRTEESDSGNRGQSVNLAESAKATLRRLKALFTTLYNVPTLGQSLLSTQFGKKLKPRRTWQATESWSSVVEATSKFSRACGGRRTLKGDVARSVRPGIFDRTPGACRSKSTANHRSSEARRHGNRA